MIKQADVESRLLDTVQLDKYVKEIAGQLEKATFHTINYKSLDKFISGYFAGIENTLEILLVRAFILGEMFGTKPDKQWKDLPTEQDFIKTTRTEEALKYVKQRGAYALQQATEQTKIKTNEIVYQGLKDNQGWREIAKTLKSSIKEDGELQRFWGRVAITESVTALNNGYLATQKVGSYVIGQGYDDACQYCKDLVIGKVFKIGEEPSESFNNLDPLSQEYKDLVKYWENYVWVGKDNVGKSGSQRKLDDNGKPTIMRLRHEMYYPTAPVHVSCRCQWISLDPDFFYSNKEGQLIPKKRDTDKWNEWVNKNIKEIYEKGK